MRSVPELLIPASFSRKQVLRLARISPQQLAAWERCSLVPSKDRYEQADLLLLKNLRILKESGIRAEGMKSLASVLRRRFGTSGGSGEDDPLAFLRLRHRGKRIAVHWEGAEMEARSGQLLLELAPSQLEVIVSFPAQSKDEKQDKSGVMARKQEAADAFFQALERENAGASASEVVAIYKKALELDKDCFGAHLNLGTLYFNQRKLKLAEQHYRAAIELHPRYVLAHFNLASLYDELGQVDRAIKLYNSTLSIDPDYVDAHYNLALLLQSLGRKMEATRHWKRFLKLDPQGEWAAIARRELQRLLEETVLPGGSNSQPKTAQGTPGAAKQTG
jgi:Tfp pilus assembly protein PilF